MEFVFPSIENIEEIFGKEFTLVFNLESVPRGPSRKPALQWQAHMLLGRERQHVIVVPDRASHHQPSETLRHFLSKIETTRYKHPQEKFQIVDASLRPCPST
ncbi:MAG: hypothetical protein JWN50_552 [Parcubacteria group bacterium]|nr:hypothetical protein [Parcubacteria group bacterium]